MTDVSFGNKLNQACCWKTSNEAEVTYKFLFSFHCAQVALMNRLVDKWPLRGETYKCIVASCSPLRVAEIEIYSLM